LTAKLKLTLTPTQFAALRATGLAYRDALNLVSQYAFTHGKTSSRRRLQDGTYAQIRAQFGLPAQMACNVPRHVAATYKGLWTKLRQNREARRQGYTKKRYKGLDKAPHYVSPTLTYNLGRDYALKAHQQVSLRTLCGRIVVPYAGYSKHVALLQHGATVGAAKLWYDRSKKRFYLLVALTLQTPDPELDTCQHVVGIDVGQRYLAALTTLENQCQFFSGAEIRQQTDHVARLQKRLRKQGTRSATRKRIALGQRERRLKQQTNHVISRRIVDIHPASLLGVEDLTGIRERTKRKHGKRASKKQRRANRHDSKWAFAELRTFLEYKAQLAGSLCIRVDADYTSQQCPRCGWTSKANRPEQGLLFVCQQCRYSLHADLVGARNIALRTLLIR
jgi:IS605 OrfB family transposase